MKTLLFVLSFFLPLITSTASDTPYYDVVGNIRVDTGDVSQESLKTWKPYTLELTIPTSKANQMTGFDTGFGMLPVVNEQGIALDSLKITKCRYSLYHLNVATNATTPVLRNDGTPMTNIDVLKIADQTTPARPTLFTTSPANGNPLNGYTTSENGNSANQPLYKVEALFSTKHKFVFGSSTDFTQPTVGHGYIVRWDISFIPTHLGVQYPEATLKANGKDSLEFVYKVEEVPTPQFLKLDPNGPYGGTLIQFSGPQLEYFVLQRSTDLKNWEDCKYDYTEGDYWIGHTTPGDDGFYSNVYQWLIFKKEQDGSNKEFFRMNWTGTRGTWRYWSPTES